MSMHEGKHKIYLDGEFVCTETHPTESLQWYMDMWTLEDVEWFGNTINFITYKGNHME